MLDEFRCDDEVAGGGQVEIAETLDIADEVAAWHKSLHRRNSRLAEVDSHKARRHTGELLVQEVAGAGARER